MSKVKYKNNFAPKIYKTFIVLPYKNERNLGINEDSIKGIRKVFSNCVKLHISSILVGGYSWSALTVPVIAGEWGEPTTTTFVVHTYEDPSKFIPEDVKADTRFKCNEEID